MKEYEDYNKDTLSSIIKSDKRFEGTEILEVVSNYEGLSDFYCLLKTFAEIGLNSIKIDQIDCGEIRACFKYDDINKAVDASNEFYNKHKITDIDSFIDAIHYYHPFALDNDDERQKCAYIENNHSTYVTGYFYTFNALPESIWSSIEEEIKKQLIG